MFIVYSLSRSRSFWLSKFLTYGAHYCAHNLRLRAPSLDWLKGFLSVPNIGATDPGMIELWPMLSCEFPNHRQVVVHRPRAEIKASFDKLGFPYGEPEHREVLLQAIGSIPGVLNVTFEGLQEEEVCKSVFEFCLGVPFDRQHWLDLKDQNLQTDFQQNVAQIKKNAMQIARVNAEAEIK